MRLVISDGVYAAYQVAHDDLAVNKSRGRLGRSSLGVGIAGSLGGLLDTADWRSRGGRASGRASRVATTASRGLALGRGDLVERLVELARHIDGCDSADFTQRRWSESRRGRRLRYDRRY
jgi:hypothetical protein